MKLYTKIAIIALFAFSLYGCGNSENKEDEKSKSSSQEQKDSTDIDKISKKIRETPKNALLFRKRAELHADKGKFKEAINDLEISLKLEPAHKETYYSLVDYHLKLGQSGKAKEVAEKCLKKYPDDKETKLRLAQIYYYVKDYKKALQYIRDINNANQMDADSYFVEALIYRESDKPSLAIRALQKTIEYDKDHIAAYIMLGKLLSEAKDPLAEEYLKAGLRKAPENIELHYNLGFYYQQQNAIDSAVEQYQYIIDNLDSLHYGAYYNSGFIDLVYKKNFERAVKKFSKAIKANPKSHKAYYNRGYAYELMGNKSAARVDYNNALKYKENYELAIRGLNSLDKN